MVGRTIVMAGILVILSFPMAGAEENEREIPLSEVPQTVIEAAEKEMEGLSISEAEIIEKDNGDIVYEVEGKIGMREYELIITPDGEVISTETDD